MDNLSDESSSDDEKEGLSFLLGGLSVDQLSNEAWENESCDDEDDEKEEDTAKTETDASSLQQPFATTEPRDERALTRHPVVPLLNTTKTSVDSLFHWAHACDRDGRLKMPSVQVVDLSASGRGSGLIATAKIDRGELIYTERAAIATQIPQGDDDGDTTAGSFSVRACQHCFRSLEPVASCTDEDSPKLPMAHLWPIPEFDFATDASTDEPFRKDKYGRCICKTCQATFCSSHCRTQTTNQFGSCCTRTSSLLALLTLVEGQVQSAVAMTVCMFQITLQNYRQTNNLCGTVSDGLCGDAMDVTALELGNVLHDTDDNVADYYTLGSVYNQLVKLLNMSEQEQDLLSLQRLHQMAAQAARNGVGIQTQSPFKAYHASLLRHAGGRGSTQHEELSSQVARALGSTDGKLSRGMDRIVEDRVAPEVVALFPLTARMNHSCQPNAVVKSQEFMDCHMDLVAKRDIAVGEEILISYIGLGPTVGKKSRYRRQRELQAKYLFLCDCDECQREQEINPDYRVSVWGSIHE